jgi:hypothetical protein
VLVVVIVEVVVKIVVGVAGVVAVVVAVYHVADAGPVLPHGHPRDARHAPVHVRHVDSVLLLQCMGGGWYMH